ncbi:MAG: hypothetical protein V1781_07000 [Bacteroidota bacterium]
MNLIQNIKNILGNYYLKHKMKSLHRNKAFINLEQAKTIGIVFDATEEENLELVKKYIAYLREMKKKVKAIGYFDQKQIPSFVYSKLEYDFFCSSELNWYNVPSVVYVENFLNDEFDILIDLNLDDCFPLRYISSLSKAKFKVGGKSEQNSSIFDLMIEIDLSKGIKYFLRTIDTYLFIINKKHDKQIIENE